MTSASRGGGGMGFGLPSRTVGGMRERDGKPNAQLPGESGTKSNSDTPHVHVPHPP